MGLFRLCSHVVHNTVPSCQNPLNEDWKSAVTRHEFSPRLFRNLAGSEVAICAPERSVGADNRGRPLTILEEPLRWAADFVE